MNHNNPGQPPIAAQEFTPQGPAAYATQNAGQAPSTHAPAPAPQSPRKSWFARHKFLTAILAIVVLVVLTNVFGGDEDDPAPASSTATAPATEDTAAAEDDEPTDPAPAPDVSPGIGDAVEDGKFEFTVTEVETGIAEVGNEWLAEQAQGQYVMVHVSVRNIGDQAQMFHGSNQTLVDDQGREHSADTSAAIHLEDADSFLKDINPGNAVDAVVVFDIPADAEPAALQLHDSMFSGGVRVTLTN